MSLSLEEKINEIAKSKTGECWYLVKQDTDFYKLTDYLEIFDEYKKITDGTSLEEFWNKKGISTNYRVLSQGFNYGLLKPARLGESSITDAGRAAYLARRKYYEIRDRQIEKLYIAAPNEWTKTGNIENSTRANYSLFAVPTLYAILLGLLEQTGSSAISKEEFELFVTTTKKYADYNDAIKYIIDYRKSKPKLNFDLNKLDNRVDKALEQLSTLKFNKKSKFTDSYIALNDSKLEVIKQHLNEYNQNLNLYENITHEEYIKLLDSNVSLWEYPNLVKNNEWDNVGSIDKFKKKTEPDENLNNILFGPPGTGKTYNSVNYAVAFCKDENVTDIMEKDYDDVFNEYEELKNSGRVEFVTFHQSYGYEDFIEGIRPELNVNGDLGYVLEDGVFKTFCKRAKNDLANNYVFIIDEINRGNISKIFGELITLIEPVKRYGSNEEMVVTLPYSHEKFGVPKNVYLLGTMNTADRSIAVLDTALRRRFKFIEMMPDPSVLDGVIVDNIDVQEMLIAINQRIEVLLDREHTIGHAYFTKLKQPGQNTFSNLKDIMENKIIPLLQDYFFEDYGKIQLIMNNNNFVERKEVEDDLFENSDTNIPESIYIINPSSFNNVENYVKIYQK